MYLRPYDPNRPVVCMDETSKQLIADIRVPIAAKPGHPQRYYVEYKRCGVTNVFMFTEPLGQWRRVSVTNYRKRLDWAEQIRTLLEEDYPDAEVVVLVMDNLNTHSIGSLYLLLSTGITANTQSAFQKIIRFLWLDKSYFLCTLDLSGEAEIISVEERLIEE